MAWAAAKYVFLPKSPTVLMRKAFCRATASSSVTPASALTGAARISAREEDS